MMRKLYIIPAFLLLNCLLHAQPAKLHVKVIDAVSGEGIAGVEVLAGQNQHVFVTDSAGFIQLPASRLFMRIQLYRLGYLAKDTVISSPAEAPIIIALLPNEINFDAVDISTKKIRQIGPDPTQFIFDYLPYEGLLYLLVYDKRLNKRLLLLWGDQNDSIHASAELGAEGFYSLYPDCKGNVFALGEEWAGQVEKIGDQLDLYNIRRPVFETAVRPCVAFDGESYYVKQKLHDYLLAYYKVSLKDTIERELFHTVKDKQAIRVVEEEMGILAGTQNGRQSLEAYRKAFQAALDSRYLKEVAFPPTYAPLVCFGEKLYLFDFSHQQLIFFTPEAEQKIPISFHKKRGWKRALLVDKIEEKIYVRYEKNGISSIHQIELETGKTTEVATVELPFCSHFRIEAGSLYLLYSDNNYDPVKRLYRKEI